MQHWRESLSRVPRVVGALALVCAVARSTPAAAQATPHGSSSAVAIPAALPAGLEAICDARLQRHRLKNGIEVVLRPQPGGQTVHVRSSVHVGSRNDPPGHEGLAHYVEHLTFRPVPGFAPVHELYEEAGATGMNASTALDTTDYYATVPTAQLERALWIEARRLALGIDLVADEPAQRERQVLQREHAMRYGTGVLLEERQAVHSALFPSGHPYHKRLASQESQAKLSLSDARWFFARHYRPERVRLVLAGDFEPAAALALAERWFGGLRAKADVPAAPGELSDACAWAKQPLAPTARRLRVSSRGENESLTVHWPLAATEEPEQWRGLLNYLEQRLRIVAEETGVSAAVRLGVTRGELGHYYTLRLPLAPAQPFGKAEPLLATVLEKARHVSGQELQAAARSIDVWTRTGDRSLEEQTLQLAERRCVPLVCPRPAARLASRVLAELERFELGRALMVERVHDPNAPDEGDVEVVR